MIELDSDETNIGVGMGGSCPSCRAPIDLGQEFCLECGAAIRFSNRPKSGGKRAGAGGVGGTRAGAPGENRGFPWVPFGIVLGLIIAVLVLLFVDPGGDSEKSSSPKATTEPALPSITNSTPDGGEGETTTVDDCSSVNSAIPQGSGSTGQPTDSGALGATAPPSGETIPELDPSSLGMLDPSDLGITPPNGAAPGSSGGPDPAITNPDDPTSSSDSGGSGADTGAGGTTTVDRNGTPCTPNNDLGTPITTPTTPSTPSITPSSTSPLGTPSTSTQTNQSTTNSTTTTNANAVSTWPAGKVGWTVIVFGYSDENRANERAADLKADGFEAGVLNSDDYGSLCPGIYAVFSGVFDTETQANNRKRQLQGKYQGMYVRKIDKNGTNSGCSSR